ncbi:hypothetical protein ACKWTF_006345 [Chironomus riparius]
MNRQMNNFNFFSTLSPSIKLITVITLFGYLLSFSETAINALSVIPGNLLPSTFAIWTAFTFCFLEIHIWEVIIDIVCVTLCLKLIEPLWDQVQIFAFFAVVNFSVAVLSSLYYLLLYSITKNTEILFDVKIHGLIGFLAGLCVAIMLVMPNLLIAKTPYFGNFTNRNLPLTFMITSIILWALNLISGTYPVMFCSGLFSSFIYLRFYQRHSNGIRGTNSESFIFANFFPTSIQPVINLLVNPIYKLSLNVGIVKHQPIIPLNHSSSDMRSLTMSITPSDQQDNERRRAIALKALNERWKALNAGDTNKSQLPKSFPQTNVSSKSQSSHHSHHGHSHSHQHERKVIPKFNIDELIKPIPLPPPPSMMQSSPSETSDAQK